MALFFMMHQDAKNGHAKHLPWHQAYSI